MTTPESSHSPSTDDPPKPGRRPKVKRAFRKLTTLLTRHRSSAEPDSSNMAASQSSAVAEDQHEPQIAAPLSANTAISTEADPIPTFSGPEDLEVDDSPNEEPCGPAALVYIRGATNRDRARTLFAKYGLPLEELEWPIAAESETALHMRIEKSIRMRVRFTCHRCSTTFGNARVCQNCNHVRCRQCLRSPTRRAREKSKRSKDEKGKEKEKEKEVDEPTLSEPNAPSTDVIEMQHILPAVRKPIVQRLRRICHKCRTPFVPSSAQLCSACGHLRCSKCAPEQESSTEGPTDADAGIEVESGDESRSTKKRVYRKPRQRLRWYCHECTTIYIEGSKICSQCVHTRCDQCIRIPKKRIKADQLADPDILQAVQDRLAGLGRDNDAEASPPLIQPNIVDHL